MHLIHHGCFVRIGPYPKILPMPYLCVSEMDEVHMLWILYIMSYLFSVAPAQIFACISKINRCLKLSLCQCHTERCWSWEDVEKNQIRNTIVLRFFYNRECILPGFLRYNERLHIWRLKMNISRWHFCVFLYTTSCRKWTDAWEMYWKKIKFKRKWMKNHCANATSSVWRVNFDVLRKQEKSRVHLWVCRRGLLLFFLRLF